MKNSFRIKLNNEHKTESFFTWDSVEIIQSGCLSDCLRARSERPDQRPININESSTEPGKWFAWKWREPAR